ncbi:MAG TPA: hypothetical protein VOA87_23665 [Thermoanaerobaculia bacterium]|nr:hypothetical protein [Thermoanaerobaculia bacterium]
MSALKFLLGLAAAVLVQFVGVKLFPDFPRVVDVFLVVVALHAFSGNSLTALLAGLLVGLLEDTLTGGGLYGLYGFADTIIGYSVARLAQRLVIQRATGVLGVISFASLAQQGIVVGLALLLLPSPPLPRPLWVGIKALGCGILGMLLYAGAARWTRTYESRRRGRMSRLRMG